MRRLKRWWYLSFSLKFNHDFTNHFEFTNVQNNKIFEIFKMSKNNSSINIFYCTKGKRL